MTPAPARTRDAVPADLDGLTALEALCFPGDRLSRRSLRTLIEAPTAALRVAVRDRAIVGYGLLLFRAGTGIARLYGIAVHPGERGSGLGARLLADAERQARARGRQYLRLEVREDNHVAIRLYERAGYRRIGRCPAYYEDKAAALRFEKRLAGKR